MSEIQESDSHDAGAQIIEQLLAALEESIDPTVEFVHAQKREPRAFDFTLHDPFALCATSQFHDQLREVLTFCGLLDVETSVAPTKSPRKPRNPFKFAKVVQNQSRRHLAAVVYFCTLVGPVGDLWLLLRGGYQRYQEQLRMYEDARQDYDADGFIISLRFQYPEIQGQDTQGAGAEDTKVVGQTD